MAKKSPFPGMDPWLERHWGDVHHSLVQYARDQLQERLPDPLRARVEERVYLEREEGWRRNVFPDVRIVERPTNWRSGEARAGRPEADGGVSVAEPLVLIVPSEALTEGYIEIRDGASGNQVVTVIEVLSPANKAGANGTRMYRQKQLEVLSGDASLVEIDLLRGGRRVTAVPLGTVPPTHRTPYHVCVHRGWRGEEFELYKIPLRERLPVIPMPLRRSDSDVTLDLQALIDQVYRLGRYDDMDYGLPLEPPLSDEDAAWAAGVVKDRR